MAEERADSRGEARQSFFAKQQLINSARSAFQQLSAVLKNSALYPVGHPYLLSTAAKFVETIEGLAIGRKEAAFYIVAGELFFDTYSVPIDQSISALIEEFAARELGGVMFKPGLTPGEIISFSALLRRDARSFVDQADINKAIADEHIAHIDVHRVVVVDRKAEGDVKEEGRKAAEIFMDAVEAVKEMALAVRGHKAANPRKINTVVQTMIDSILDNRDAFLGLTSIKMYDEYTFAHSVNTSILAVSLGVFLSFEKPQIAALGVAALLHDIGKLSVPIDIINKPGELTADEWELVKRHPIEGALILSDIPAVSKLAMIAAFEHHQHGDTRGYPVIDDRTQLHPYSEIVALADAYEALTAARVYYSAQMPPDQAIRILIKKRGTKFEPTLVKAFVNMLGLFPVGTVLKMDTGEIGLVEHQTGDLLRPRVLLLNKFDGSEKGTGIRVSLLETVRGQYKRTPVGTIDPYKARIDVKKYLA